jgi:H+/Cl- antiporter ClcA
MKFIKLIFSTILVGVGVALTYYIFEAVVRNSIDYIWYDLFDTENNRLMMVVLTFVITALFFGSQHILDKKSEKIESKGLGETPNATITNFFKVLFIGFLSLLAGASLGPEAILVPASLILGSVAGKVFFKKESQIIKLMAVVGFVALFTSFFNSAIAGILGLLLALQQSGAKLKPIMLIVSIISAGSALLTLSIVDSKSLVQVPAHEAKFTIITIFIFVSLFAIGYAYTNILKFVFKALESVKKHTINQKWFLRSLLASSVLSLIYLLGGSLIQFTGNESIEPMLEQASALGFFGLLWIAITKISAITWSKAIGYRGGMIFPTILVAATLVAIFRIYTNEIDITYGIVVLLSGAIFANTKAKVLF